MNSPFDFADRWMALQKGLLTEEEATEFLHQIQENPRLSALHRKLLEKSATSEALGIISQYEVKKAYQNIHRTKWNRTSYRFWAAAVTLLAMTASIGFYFMRPVPEKIVYSSVQSSRYENAPRITLDDGSTILLDTLTEVVTESDLRLNNQSGQLIVKSAGKRKVERPASWQRLDIPFARRYSLRLPDGTLATLNAGATIEFPDYFSGPNREVRLVGEAYFDVAPNQNHPFVVSASGLKVTALGTAFNVMAYKNEETVQTTLVHGRVSVQDTTGQVRYLNPGQQASYGRRNGRMTVTSVNPNLYTSWMQDYFLFQETPLETIMQQIGHWYGMDVLYLNSRNKSTQYTGKIRMYSDVNAVLRKFEMTGDLSFETDQNCIRIQRK